MSLSNRLTEAARRRADAEASGIPVEDWRPARTAVIEDAPHVEASAIVLQAHVPVTAVDPDPNAEPDSICPTCGRTGELGVVDLFRRNADWSCGACGTMWRVTVAAPSSATAPPA